MNNNVVRIKRICHIAVFGILYLISFFYIEQRKVKVHIIQSEIDEMIPFCEYFIIPYFLWFLFVGACIVYFTLYNENDREYYCLMGTLAVGMGLFIVVSFLYPNGHTLRPFLSGEGFFIEMVRFLYSIDTSTNILPSIHVYNAAACCIAVCHNERCKKHDWLINGTLVLTILIILSTVFLKQHTLFDVVLALAVNIFSYQLFYKGIHGRCPVNRLTKVRGGMADGKL